MYKRILIPIDGSEPSEKAAEHGVKLATAVGAEIVCLYVIDISAFTGIPTEAIWENMRGLLEEEGKGALSGVEEMAEKNNVKFESIVKDGIPSEDIARTAGEKDIDVIVMGTAGRSGLDKFLLGSVTEKVMRTAPCPVLVIRK
ncbi:MAG: universal stress protein [Candidatus Hydrothermarchaeaceae archaeon]